MAEHGTLLQLYSVRQPFAIDARGTLDRIREIGYDGVELWDFVRSVDRFEALLGETGLAAPSGHANLIGDGIDTAAALSAAARLGLTSLYDPMQEESRWDSVEAIKAFAGDLNATARAAQDLGITVGYHNHWWEFGQFDGALGLEVFADALEDDIALEIDVYWAQVGGVDAAELVRSLGNRVKALHLGDGPVTSSIDANVALGDGRMNLPEILAAAPDAVRIVELDDYPGDVLAAAERSLRYVESRCASQ